MRIEIFQYEPVPGPRTEIVKLAYDIEINIKAAYIENI